jgi:L-lactate dehydrogenase complex protein LldG
MTTRASSREAILHNLRSSIPTAKVEHPGIPEFELKTDDVRAEFELRLREAGGVSHALSSPEEARAKLAELHPLAKVICSAVPEIAGTRSIHDVTDPHELADVDVGIVRAQFGIAEGGGVWFTQEDLVFNALGFLSQHLIVLLDPDRIVADMHEAYRRVHLDKTAFGCFMAGPSATADVEATLVHGAQGPRSLNVFFLPPNERKSAT